jgi:gliding motility-associated protein GldM
MLALNVSKDVLNAFNLINEKMHMTNENFIAKNQIVYAALDKAAAENPAKAGEKNRISLEVKKKSQDLIDTLQYFKDLIICTGDGHVYSSLKKNEHNQAMIENPEKPGEMVVLEEVVNSKDNTDVPAQLMYGDANNGYGSKVLRPLFDEYREFMLSFTGLSEHKKEGIEQSLSTHGHEENGVEHPWESMNFEHLPLLAVVTNITQMQNSIRNAEGDVISYFYSSLDASSFKFNKLSPIVIPNSNYVMSGSDYSAQIFLAAFDTTAPPTVEIGSVKKSKGQDGTITYSVDNGKVVKVDTATNMATYTVRTSATGEKKYEGLIKIKSPSSDDTLVYPFESEYIVAQPSLVISPTKMNVFYVGVENPVDISVPGIPSNNILPSISGGTITKSAKGGYVVKVRAPGSVKVSVAAKIDGKTKPMGAMDFRAKKVPDPVAKVAGQKGGNIAASLLKAAKRVDAVMENFDFDLNFAITEFTVSTKTSDGYTIDKKSNSEKITSEQKALLGNVKKGQKIYFEEVKAKGPDGSVRELGTVMFKVQ